jgi:hypothetical protein
VANDHAGFKPVGQIPASLLFSSATMFEIDVERILGIPIVSLSGA